MYNILKKLYKANKINDAKLHNAVDKGWITQEQYDEIVTE